MSIINNAYSIGITTNAKNDYSLLISRIKICGFYDKHKNNKNKTRLSLVQTAYFIFCVKCKTIGIRGIYNRHVTKTPARLNDLLNMHTYLLHVN